MLTTKTFKSLMFLVILSGGLKIGKKQSGNWMEHCMMLCLLTNITGSLSLCLTPVICMIFERKMLFQQRYGCTVYSQCNVLGVEEGDVTIFLAVSLIQKTEQSPGIQVMHPEPGRDRYKLLILMIMMVKENTLFIIVFMLFQNFLLHLYFFMIIMSSLNLSNMIKIYIFFHFLFICHEINFRLYNCFYLETLCCFQFQCCQHHHFGKTKNSNVLKYISMFQNISSVSVVLVSVL